MMHWASEFTLGFRGHIAFVSALARKFLCRVSFAHKLFSLAWILSRPCICHETTASTVWMGAACGIDVVSMNISKEGAKGLR